jgi:Na+-driven multidrug efflux pump
MYLSGVVMAALLVVRIRTYLVQHASHLIGHGICPQPMYCIWSSAEAILLFLKQDPEVAHLAAVYLRWVSFGLPGMALPSPSPDSSMCCL